MPLNNRMKQEVKQNSSYMLIPRLAYISQQDHKTNNTMHTGATAPELPFFSSVHKTQIT